MNIQLLLQLLMSRARYGRIPQDGQAPTGIQDFRQIDKDMVLPLYMDQYASQPKYVSPSERLQNAWDLEQLYYTQPRRGVMPRRTRLGVEEGYRQSDHDWMFNSGIKF